MYNNVSEVTKAYVYISLNNYRKRRPYIFSTYKLEKSNVAK